MFERFRRALVLALVSLAFAYAHAADATKINFNLPAGEAGKTLKQFALQAKREIMFPSQRVDAVKTNAVVGELTVREGLDQLLAGTELKVFEDAKTGALVVQRSDDPNVPRVEPEAVPARKNQSKVEAGKLVLEKMAVTGTRVDGLINKGLLQGGPEAPLYHSVVDREEIERLGITNLQELFRLIPQTSSAVTSMQANDNSVATSGGNTSRFSTTSLRGFNSAQTVILVNGRALPRSTRSGGGPDLNRIPVAAIQRIEIMPYAGSAIYGAGAIGGAINIILRKDYSGRDITAYVGTSTEGGGTESRLTYLEGRTFNGGRTSLTLTFSVQHREAITAGQRGFVDQLIERYPVGTANYFSYVLPALSSAPGAIYTTNVAGLGIPGAGNTRFAVIPSGTTVAQSQTLTPESFIATAGKLAPTYRANNVVLYTPQETYNGNAQIEHKFIEDKLEGYAELTYGNTRMDYSFPQFSAVNLSATDPLNPFRTNVTPGFVGRSVTVHLDPLDLGLSRVVYDYENIRAVLGLKGRISELWEWSLDGTMDRSDATVSSNNPGTNILSLNALTATGTPGPAAPVATRRAIYPLLADHTLYPVSAADAANYFPSYRNTYGYNRQYEFNARVIGDVFELPAGWLKSSVFGKYRNFDLESGQFNTGSAAFAQLIHNGPFPASPSGTKNLRDTWQGAMELAVPVISQAWRPLPVDEFTLNLSAGYERNITNGENLFTNVVQKELTSSAKTYVAAAKLQVIPDVAFRASYSDALAVPDWDQTGDPPTVFLSLPFLIDPKRGNTIQTQMFDSKFGGNPDLKSETAESLNFGVILKPRFLPGLTLNIDWWNIEKQDAVAFPSTELMLDRPGDYPGRVVRAAPTAEDLALGWEGVLLSVDTTYINIGRVRTDGVDARLNYRWETKAAGTFQFTTNTSFTNHFRTQQEPGTPWIENAGTQNGPLRWRGYGNVTWMKSAFSVGVTARYVGHYFSATTDPSPPYPNANRLDGGRIPAFMRYDLQFGYEIPYQTGERGWRQWASGTKWTIGALNFLNEEPSFVTNVGSYYNRYDDIRQRYVYMQLKKSF